MCEACRTAICSILDMMIDEYRRDYPVALESPGRERPKYMSLELSKGPKAPVEYTALKELIDRAPGIGMSGFEFKTELSTRSGFGEAIEAWANQGKIPNGLARQVILTCAENILRDRGAVPERTLLAA